MHAGLRHTGHARGTPIGVPLRQPIRPGQGSVSLTDFGSQACIRLLVVGDPTAIGGRYWPLTNVAPIGMVVNRIRPESDAIAT